MMSCIISLTFHHCTIILILILTLASSFLTITHTPTAFLHFHNSLRHEINTIVDAVKAADMRGKLQEWEIKCLQSMWLSHYENTHAHHVIEHDITIPFLNQRFNYYNNVSEMCACR
jgi:hypothetical protein